MLMGKRAWITLDSREAYSDRGFTVVENQVARPDGAVAPYGVVHALPGTSVVVLSSSLEVTLVRQYRYPLDRYTWELPGGGVEENETPLCGVQRELWEETGITARRWMPLGDVVHVNSSISTQTSFAFLAWDLVGRSGPKDEMEISDIQLVTIEAAIEMAERGVISDALSQIALLRAYNVIRDANWRDTVFAK